ncbi:MAG: hypothetical protein M3072_14200 [Candidatus Dormibacteraeota bacterium]|nr:hypothetical protein [Candidatus Dormibacteraeota bacterium]
MTGDLDEDLREELLRPVARDQEVRNRIIELGLGGSPEADAVAQEVEDIDRENTDWLRGVVESQGWPRSSKVGRAGANAAWLLAQHADRIRHDSVV